MPCWIILLLGYIHREVHQLDLQAGAGWVWLPYAYAYAVKNPQMGRQPVWQYVFPAENINYDPRPGAAMEGETLPHETREADLYQMQRHHIHDGTIQQTLRRACQRS